MKSFFTSLAAVFLFATHVVHAEQVCTEIVSFDNIYTTAVKAAQDEKEKTIATARAERDKKKTLARAEYQRTKDTFWTKYREQRAEAIEKFRTNDPKGFYTYLEAQEQLNYELTLIHPEKISAAAKAYRETMRNISLLQSPDDIYYENISAVDDAYYKTKSDAEAHFYATKDAAYAALLKRQ